MRNAKAKLLTLRVRRATAQSLAQFPSEPNTHQPSWSYRADTSMIGSDLSLIISEVNIFFACENTHTHYIIYMGCSIYIYIYKDMCVCDGNVHSSECCAKSSEKESNFREWNGARTTKLHWLHRDQLLYQLSYVVLKHSTLLKPASVKSVLSRFQSPTYFPKTCNFKEQTVNRPSP